MDNPILHKPTATIHVGNTLSLLERKIFNVLAWNSQKHQFSKRTDIVSQDLLFNLVGLQRSKNTQHIKDCLERLTTSKIEWNALGKDKTQVWGICTFLAGAELKSGRIRYAINPLLVEKINHPTVFAKIQLLVQTQFSSKYALALYEFFIDELSRVGADREWIGETELHTLCVILQYRGPFKFLNKDVLKPCVKEINRDSDIDIAYEPIKKGRKVEAIRWKAKKKLEFQLALNLFDGTAEAAVGDHEVKNVNEDQALIGCLVHKGVSERKARRLVDRYGSERVAANIDVVEARQKSGETIKNIPAYIVCAIEDDYRPRKSPEALTVEQHHFEKENNCAEVEKRKRLEGDWRKFRSTRLKEIFAGKPEEWQQSKRDQFVADLEEKSRRGPNIAFKTYCKSGFKSSIVQGMFLSGLARELLVAPEEVDFEAYLAWRHAQKTGKPQPL